MERNLEASAGLKLNEEGGWELNANVVLVVIVFLLLNKTGE